MWYRQGLILAFAFGLFKLITLSNKARTNQNWTCFRWSISEIWPHQELKCETRTHQKTCDLRKAHPRTAAQPACHAGISEEHSGDGLHVETLQIKKFLDYPRFWYVWWLLNIASHARTVQETFEGACLLLSCKVQARKGQPPSASWGTGSIPWLCNVGLQCTAAMGRDLPNNHNKPWRSMMHPYLPSKPFPYEARCPTPSSKAAIHSTRQCTHHSRIPQAKHSSDTFWWHFASENMPGPTLYPSANYRDDSTSYITIVNNKHFWLRTSQPWYITLRKCLRGQCPPPIVTRNKNLVGCQGIQKGLPTPSLLPLQFGRADAHQVNTSTGSSHSEDSGVQLEISDMEAMKWIANKLNMILRNVLDDVDVLIHSYVLVVGFVGLVERVSSLQATAHHRKWNAN